LLYKYQQKTNTKLKKQKQNKINQNNKQNKLLSKTIKINNNKKKPIKQNKKN